MSTTPKIHRTTHGPWQVVSRFTGPLEIVGENKQIIAMVASEMFGEAVANAELIAAAPEMFAALKLLTKLNGTGADANAWAAAHAAIAKAEGR